MNKDKKILIVAAALLSVALSPGAWPQGTEIQGGGTPGAAAPNAASPDATTAASPAAPSNVIYIGQDMPYSDVKAIDRAVLAECPLPQQGAELLEKAARKAGFNVVRNDDAVKAGKGRILQVEIINAISGGNAFIGHRKQVSVKGRLIEDGKEIGNFYGMRYSGGGAFGGFKGSCPVLGRCLETLAGDIALWLQNPAKDSRFGN